MILRFILNEPADTAVSIFDINGKLVWVKKLPAGQTTPGINEVVWMGINSLGRGVSNGIYIYRISAGGGNVSKKFAVIR